MSAGDWCLIESDPGVFSELLRGFGASGLQVEEVYSLDESTLATLGHVYGLVFLFKIDKEASKAESEAASVVKDSRLDEMFFAKQVIHNACATQAILNLVFNLEPGTTNSEGGKFELGGTLGDFKDFTKAFDAQTTGLAISNSEALRKVHNSFARNQIFEMDEKAPSKEEDLFHFVGYVPIKGRVYELDGLQEGPIDHGSIECSDWLSKARDVIQARMQKYAAKEIRFSLMALVEDRRAKLQRGVASLEAAGLATDEAMIELAKLQSELDEEEARVKKQKQDNVRRRHNYMPLVIAVLQEMARQGTLTEFYNTAKSRCDQLRKQEASSAAAAPKAT